MPGMAGTGIAIEITKSIPGVSGNRGNHAAFFAPRPRLVGRTMRLIGMDAAITALSALMCFALLLPAQSLTTSPVLISTTCLAVVVILSFLERGLYAPAEVVSHTFAWRKIVLAWLQAVAVATLVIVCVSGVTTPGSAAAAFDHMDATSRAAWLPVVLFAGFATLTGARMLRLRFHSGPQPLNRTVIIGEESEVQDLLLRIRTGAKRNFDVIGVVEQGTTPTMRQNSIGLPLFHGIDTLERMIRQDAVDTVIVALPWSAGDQMRSIIERISMAPVDCYVYPGIDGLNLPLRHVDRIFDLPLLMACTRPIDGWKALVKRWEDVAISLALLIFISPIMMTIAAAVKLTSDGPVFFRQRRLGYNNRVIEVLKFRSMFTHLSDADATQQAFRGDTRVTPIGAWLRRLSLDELPQLLNVLKGDMSLVGPRPHALATTAGGLALEDAVPVYSSRHRVKPGITGWAQVNGHRGALDSVDKIVHRVNHDLYYIEHWSLGLDLKILWRTARLVFADDNAF